VKNRRFYREAPNPTIAVEGYIYIFYAPEANRVKIGRALHWRTRLAQIQSFSPIHLKCIYLETIIPENGNTALKREQEIQERFNQYRLWGEWFQVEGELAEFLKPYILGRAKVRELCEE